jgi:hypothetical protein
MGISLRSIAIFWFALLSKALLESIFKASQSTTANQFSIEINPCIFLRQATELTDNNKKQNVFHGQLLH